MVPGPDRRASGRLDPRQPGAEGHHHSAALLAPTGILLGRLAGGSRGRWIARLGVAAAAVQVIGLSRWVLLVPGISRDATDPAKTADAHHAFELAHTWLGTVSGSTPPPSPTSPATSPGASG